MEAKLTVTYRALVFGNDDYQYYPELRCSINDAGDIAEKLREIGFEVTIAYNQTYVQMVDAISKFIKSVRKNDFVVVFFSGHGIERQTYMQLLPIDCPNLQENPDQLKKRSINVDETFESIRDRTSSTIIFLLDCCRTNLDVNNRPMTSGTRKQLVPDSAIVYACGPNQSVIDGSLNARNSVFTSRLLEYLIKPELTVSEVMFAVTNACYIDTVTSQAPHMSCSLRTTHLYFNKEGIHRPQVNPPHPARWKQNGITAAGGNGQGDDINQLNRPCGIFVDDDRTVYVADCWNNRVVAWKMNAEEGIAIAGGEDAGDRLDQLNIPIDVTIDYKTRRLLISDYGNQRIMSFSCAQNSDRPNEGKIIVRDINCWGLAMDNRRSLYVSDPMKHEVRRYDAENYDRYTVVAGGHGQGDALDQLNGPTHLFVDDQLTLYIADVHNHRVVKWPQGASQGVIVAGGKEKGEDMNQLQWPRGVWVDGFRNVYVADSGNNRVVRYEEFLERQTMVIGENEDELNSPHGIFFDRHGHLYVVDNFNCLVRCFERIK